MKLRATAMFYALMLTLLVSLVSAGFIFSKYITICERDQLSIQTRLIHNCHSAIEILLTGSENVQPNSIEVIDLFGAEQDSVLMIKRAWGGFEVVSAQAFSGNQAYTETYLVGSPMSWHHAFYLSDMGRPVSFSGKTVVRGNCRLPEAGVKRGYIEGQSFIGNKLIDGIIHTSERKLPSHELEGVRVTTDLEELHEDLDSLVDLDILYSPVQREFNEKTLVIFSIDSLALSGVNLKGNIKVISDNVISIGANCELERVICEAPRIYVEDGFVGEVQLIASERIEVGESVEMNYPSALILKVGEKSGDCLVGDNTTVEGAVCLLKSGNSQNGVVSIGSGTHILGEVFSVDRLELKGKVVGSVTAKRLLLRTPSAIYENHLLGAFVDGTQLGDQFVSIISREGKRQIISRGQ